jgi:heat shock protein HspQ
VSEQNLWPDDENGPIRHPLVTEMFDGIVAGRYQLKPARAN